MNTAWKIVLIILAALIVAGGVFTGAFFLGRRTSEVRAIREYGFGMPGFGLDGDNDSILPRIGTMPRIGMMQRSGILPRMGRGDFSGRIPGKGMMDGDVRGGMMGSFLSTGEISIEEAIQAAEKYLNTLANDDLVVSEVMIFDNGAYVVVKESSTGIGAMELLVDPNSRQVIPEFGPNHMWNLKYGNTGMIGRGHMNVGPEDATAEMTVTADQAVTKAQAYLDAELKGASIDGEPIAFYGYYSMDFEQDGKVAGMLSVNGYTGQVWLHSWHGTFVEEAEVE